MYPQNLTQNNYTSNKYFIFFAGRTKKNTKEKKQKEKPRQI